MSNRATWENDVEASRVWRETDGAEGATVQWVGEDLSGQDLRNAVLVEATLLNSDFSDCELAQADLSRAMAGGARFARARLNGATFIKSDLTSACFDQADASGARFVKATLDRASFAEAALQGASFERASCIDAVFRAADLRNASVVQANLHGADLSTSNLEGARFEGTAVDAATRLTGCLGLELADVCSIIAEAQPLRGKDAHAWLLAQARRPLWSIEQFQLWALGKMSGARVAEAVAALGATEAQFRDTAAALDRVFDQPGHAAAEYRRILGAPLRSERMTLTGTFAGSIRHAYQLPLWPDVVFVVHEDRNGIAWGCGFESGGRDLPNDLDEVQPWQWGADRLRNAATSVEVHEEWSYDLDATLTFAGPSGDRRYRARFDLGLLQRWES